MNSDLTESSCITYPATRLGYNPFEHAQSTLSNALTSVLIVTTWPGDFEANNFAFLFSNSILNLVLENLSRYWKHLEYDASMVTLVPIKSREGFKACDEQNAINNFVYTSFWELHGGSGEIKLLPEVSILACK